CIKILAEVLEALDVGEYVIRVSHRSLLLALLELAGVPEPLLRTTCSSIDKLDKVSLEVVEAELRDKGLDPRVVDQVGIYVSFCGDPAYLRTFFQHDLEGASASLR